MPSADLSLVVSAPSLTGPGRDTGQPHHGTGSWSPPPAGYTAVGQALARAAQPDYFGWLEHVRSAAGCTRPIRLTGTLSTIEVGTGRIFEHRHTDQLPDAAIYKACGNRRASICPSCAATYQADAFQLLRAGIVGGKGIPDTVTLHPAVFATFTAPSFGEVHTRYVKKHTCADRRRCDCRPEPCHARRTADPCPHDVTAICWARHEPDDSRLGQPFCLDCYDYDHQAVWNLFTGHLWHRTKQAAERFLARLCKQRGIPRVPVISPTTGKITMKPPIRLSHGKAAEMQRRGAVHFHALVRLDGVDPTDPTAIVAPPAGLTVDDLTDALRHAATATHETAPPHPDHPDGWSLGWGKQLDLKPLRLKGNGDITDDQAAAYLAKYATKSTEATGHVSTRLTAETIDQYADANGNHTERLIDACWRLGRPTRPTRPLASRPVTYPEPGERRTFDTPWDCPTCGQTTRYAACPTCPTDCQPSLDTQPNSDPEPATYQRLRRWAHMLGFGGHFLTKARRYSTTFTALRAARITYRRVTDLDHAGISADLDQLVDQAVTVGALTFAGAGWHTTGDALLANTAAALARDRHRTGREELAHETGTHLSTPALQAA